MKSLRNLIPILALGVAAAACGKQEEATLVYQAVPVTTRNIKVTAEAAGSIIPDTVVEVKSKASGEILTFPVQTGELVQRGTLLATIDKRVTQNQFNQSQAQLDVVKARLANAETQLKRTQELFASQAVTEQELETAQLAVANAKAAVVSAQVDAENAQIALDNTEVRAPITGTIISKPVQRGAVITSPTSAVGGGTTLLTMADLSLVQVKTFVDETDIGKLHPGLPAQVDVDAFPNKPFRGTVLKIEPQADTIQNVTMFPVLVRIDNRDGLLRPGMNANVNISVGEADSVLAVPNAALRTEQDVASAASVLGISNDDLQEMLTQAREQPKPTVEGDSGASEQKLAQAGGTPSREQVQAIVAKMRSGKELTADETALMTRMRQQSGNGGSRGRNGGRGSASSQDALFGGTYIVFTLRGGKPTPVYVQTGITDLDYSEVKSGLTLSDSVLLLPSASLIQAQQGLQERMSRRSGLPGQSR